LVRLDLALKLFFFAVSVLVPELPSTVEFIPDQSNVACYPADVIVSGIARDVVVVLDQVKRQIRVLYHLQPLCNLTNHRKWFFASLEKHFICEPQLTQLQNWVTTYEPMIQARACMQHQLNQQGLTAIDEAFKHANSLGP
jgi:hypothetical protein